MAVYIFETPERNWHEVNNNILFKKDTIIGGDIYNKSIDASASKYYTSYKMIEFHDCEINYNSIKSGWSELNNTEGFSPKYTIEISYNDCYEISYNDIMMRTIGDVILTDLINNTKNDNDYISIAQKDSAALKTRIENKTYPYDKGFILNALSQVGGHLVSDVKSLLNRALLGNIHTASLTQIGLQLSEAAKGNVVKTGMTIAQYAKTIKNNKTIKEVPNGNLYSELPQTTTNGPNGNIYPFEETTKQKPTGDIYPEDNSNTVTEPSGNIYSFEETTKQKPIGNIFNKSTLANNL